MEIIIYIWRSFHNYDNQLCNIFSMKFLKFFDKKHLISHPSLKLYLSYLLIENKNLICLFFLFAISTA